MTEASLIIENAKVLTMDPAKPRADAIALGGALILGVGEKAEMEAFAVPITRRFDAQGKTVMPGMVLRRSSCISTIARSKKARWATWSRTGTCAVPCWTRCAKRMV